MPCDTLLKKNNPVKRNNIAYQETDAIISPKSADEIPPTLINSEKISVMHTALKEVIGNKLKYFRSVRERRPITLDCPKEKNQRKMHQIKKVNV